ncbi:DNA cytosine methyltransferase [Pseudacidovorax intermedius]|uniref:DNA (cytosine-5-)-methyltransferase n=1 Tax=Pseudacidovorax intermedius TaxID=433924 RepID=A0A147GMD7_9BURK|nr:DNA cytosine methyltransferase [Pseudacidovorax intermedius]KTT14744.1 modification methylase [Pseudacidovorax intermedius]
MLTPQFLLPLAAKLVIDLFAGGGGASTGIEQAIGRPVDVAINHDAEAIGMHEVNHPQTRHYRADIREVDPLAVTRGQAVGLLHASPDCTHHSQALGGQPRKAEIRSLAWQVLRWAGKTRPDVITLENVEQMLLWSPLVAKRDPSTGRVLTLDRERDPSTGKLAHRVAGPGERVPRGNQFLIPDPSRKGRNWDHFVGALRALGYKVEWRVICNADLGAHSTRTRLYMVARCDGLPIVWPAHTHAKRPRAGLQAHRPAADCIDWSIAGTSIFGRKKPLADATMRRIAHGMQKYVLDTPTPFIVAGAAPALVPVTHTRHTAFDIGKPLRTITTAKGGETALAAAHLLPLTHQGGHRNHDPREPMPTITAARRGEIAVTAAHLVQMGYGERDGQQPRALDPRAALGTVVAGGQKFAVASAMLVGAGGPTYAGKPADMRQPLGAVLAENHRALAGACLVQAGHGEGSGKTRRRSTGANTLRDALGTVTASSVSHGLAAAFMVQANGGFNTSHARDMRDGVSTVTTSGSQQQLVAAHLTTLRRNCTGRAMDEPVSTVTAGAEHHALLQYELSQEDEAGALRCAAFLMRYHASGGQWADLRDPMTTITTHDRLALVTVWLQGEPWVIVDITLRMLVPRELYNAQDFPSAYVIDRTASGKPLTKTAQVRMAGNSVSPLPMRLIVAANYSEFEAERLAA